MEVHARESPCCLEENVGRNVDIKGNFDESKKRRKQEIKLLHLREYIYHHGQTFARNMNVKGHSF